MHFLMMILGALATIGFLIWRVRAAAEAAKEIADVAQTAANLPRKLAFRRKTGKKGSSLITDPREAATVLMLEMARATGEITAEQKHSIEEIISNFFEFSEEDSEALLAQAAWVSQEEAGLDSLHRRIIKLVSQNVSQKELIELDGMLVEVSEVLGTPNARQLNILQNFRQMTGVVT